MKLFEMYIEIFRTLRHDSTLFSRRKMYNLMCKKNIYMLTRKLEALSIYIK
jgi:hypothetical protein